MLVNVKFSNSCFRNIDEITLNAGLSEFITENLKSILIGGILIAPSVNIEEIDPKNS